MLLDDLLRNPRLGLVPLVPAPGPARRVRGVYTTDLPDPGRYLAGGELVLTSTTWYRAPQDAEVFVRALAGAGSAALVAGTAGRGDLPEPLAEACLRHGLALLTVGDEVSFATVTESVLAGLAGPARRAPGADLHRGLVASMASGEGPDGLVEVFARASGVWCAVLSAGGRQVAGHLPELSPHQLRSAHRAALGAATFPTVRPAPAGGSVSFFPVQAPVAHRPPVAYLAAGGDYRDWAPGVADAAVQVCALLALDRVAGQERRLIEERFLRESLELLRTGDPDAAHSRLRSLGIDPTRPLVAAVVSTRGTSYGAELAAVVLEEAAGRLPGCSTPLHQDGAYLMLLPADDADARRLVTEAAVRLHPLIAQGFAAIGTGRPAVGMAALRRSVEVAEHAHRIARLGTGPVRSSGPEDLSSRLLLLASVSDEVRQLFREQLIGVLEDYDLRRRTDLLHTLTVFLDTSGSWLRCAEELHIHVNSLRYRIRRIEELTGHSLATLHDRVDFVLALEAT
ncbi:helix-turn-helix domain-containing protein [Streptacidiphilus sp. N1-10]|uniref:Helix-turn-helix domain-containing protein n=1 Tax=Streptacidiphilus jeojiensis TaxID=3229225 RepID=A0ABV6XHE6_9ACTN